MGSLTAALLLLFFLSGRSTATAACLNGGFPIEEKCNCPPMWTGDSCSETMCLNGGYPSDESKSRCFCPNGYLGVHCDAVSTFKRPQNAFSTPPTSFNFVMVNLFSTYWGGLVVSQFQTALNNHFETTTISYDSINLITNCNSPGLGDDISSFEFNFTTSSHSMNLTLPELQTPGSYKCYPVHFFQSIYDLITGSKLSETAITIFTQHPDDDLQYFESIVELATSFDIRINVVFSDDDTFVRCNNNNTQILRDLAARTGGIFVFARQFEDYGARDPLLEMVLTTHYRYEGITMDYGRSPSLSFQMNVPPAKKYYVVALSDDGKSTDLSIDASACNASSKNVLIESGSVAKALYLNGTQIMCTVTAKSTNGSVRLVAFGSDFSISPVNVRVFKSYVETQQLDSSNAQPNRGNDLYLSLHYEARSTTTIRQGLLRASDGAVDVPLDVSSREKSVFDWISNVTVKCDSEKVEWVELTFSAPMFEKRFFPIHCVEQVAKKANANTMLETEHLNENIIQTDDASSCTPVPKTLILAYSDTVTFSQYNSFIVSSIGDDIPQILPYGQWGGIRFDVQGGALTFFNNTVYSQFKSTLYGQYKWDAAIALPPGSISGSQLLDALQKIMNSTALTQNSLISVLLSQLPTVEADLTKFYKLVNMNVKVVFFIDSTTLVTEMGRPSRTLNPINQIATLTGGHFIVSNQNDMTPFRSLVYSVYTSGPGQTLLLSKNIQPLGTVIVGSIDLSKAKEDVNVTVTFSSLVQGDGSTATQPMPATIIFYPSNTNNSVNATLTQQSSSNFYSGTVSLRAGQLYNVKVMLNTKPSLLRVWTTNTVDNDVQITYKGFDDKAVDGPDDYSGAALSVTLQNSNTSKAMSLSISDCSGNQISLYDVSQTFDISPAADSGIVNFVPFFCSKPVDPSSCMTGTEKLYFAQITTDGGFLAAKSFMCAETQITTDPNCNHKDSRGNYLCGGTQSPYTRGRAGKLIDCSDPYDSNLKYNPTVVGQYGLAPFACKCPGEGPSCEQAKCNPQNLNGGAVDAFYRTYTVILIFNKYDTDGYTTFDDGSFLRANASNIWQYQFFVVCQYGDIVPIYIGRNADKFMTAIKYQKGICNTSKIIAEDLDVTSILGATFSSVGRQQRGLTVVYHELPGDSGQKLDITNLEDFLGLTQQYNQQVYIFNGYDDKPNEVTDNLKNGIMSTGGTIILINSDEDLGKINNFSSILQSANSLNAHSPVSNGATTVLKDADGYLIIGSLTGDVSSYENLCTKRISISPYTVVCKVIGDVTSIQLNNLPSSAWYSVITQEKAPLAAIIAQRVDDQPTAFAVNYTTGGPMLAIALPDDYTVSSNYDNGARMAVRQKCTYGETSVNVFERLSVGYNSISLRMKSNSGIDVSKVFPFGVTATPKCQNRATLYTPYGYCQCSVNWEGPDCSRPICQNGGVISTWNNACNCRDTGRGGQFCEQNLATNS